MYKLNVPIDSDGGDGGEEGLLGKGLEVLSEWAYGIEVDDEMVETERGVILQEWRSRKSASMRAFGELHSLHRRQPTTPPYPYTPPPRRPMNPPIHRRATPPPHHSVR